MSAKILSISIAAYNVAGCIDQAMASLCKDEELLQKIEVIIVNDGSKDQTSEIAHGYSDRFPESVVVIDKENGGYGSTINASLEVARGKYYKLLDGDDWYSTDNLRGFIAFLENSSADLVISPYYEVRENETKTVDSHKEINTEANDFNSITIQNHTFLMHEIAVNTELFRALKQPIAEKCFYTDLEYVFYVLACVNSVARYDKPVYCYKLGVEGQSVSLIGIRKHYKDFPVVARRMFAFYEKEVGKSIGNKKAALDAAVWNYTYHTYHAYTVLENPKAMKKELVTLDKEIKQSYPNVYTLGFNSKLVRLLRKSHFLAYPLICKMSREEKKV